MGLLTSVIDHGSLTGLGDDDHTLYLLASDATSRAAFASNWLDLTDAGATSLHKHDHGGMDGLGDDDHTLYLLASDATNRTTFATNWTDLTDTGATTLHKHDHGGMDGLADDDHTQYVLHTEVDDVAVNGATTDPISSNWAFDHEAAADPHPGYLTPAEGNATYWALSTDLATQAELDTHVAAADPHTVYRLESADHSHQSTGAQAGQLDHGLALTGLTDDDHTQYPLLTGRSGGQILVGGTAAGDDLIIRATSNATDGDTIFQSDPTSERFRITASGVLATGGTTLTGGEAAGCFYTPSQLIATLGCRNQADTTTIGLLGTGFSSDTLVLGYGTGGGLTNIGFFRSADGLGGGAAPTFGTIGGAGPTATAQNAWFRFVDKDGAAFWVPIWR